jgi:hypothetical protein
VVDEQRVEVADETTWKKCKSFQNLSCLNWLVL